ncbi:protection of telomeres protein 1 [Paragonimus westermani]|uniref:Protection of telomeres protein 1 n=1 Tax=Paragonimus westermani TaxID=34504 RepID=A0A5J4NR35_9TREM|nr:protection of telomeres protein 1 [Paragonimus westermani]
MLSTTYSYNELKDASGSVNIIAVVKYHRPPVKTRGSGYSLFVSLTDPSLRGAKLPCIFFNDELEKLPPIRSIGDIIVTHRLIVKEFHGELHGYGYGTVGFAAVVFSGLPTEPLEPRLSSTTCSFGAAELSRVQELREWYHAPDCPVERELDVQESEMTVFTSHPVDALPEQNVALTITRLWQLKPRLFASVEGQVVGVYRYPDEDRCTVMYLWDGPFCPDNSNRAPAFVGPPKDHIARLLRSVTLEPRLAAITAHRLPDESDWSVPVFLYDEHSMCHTVKPGDIVRVRNVHVTKCPSFDCDRPDCLRLIVHGGGHRFRRGVDVLGRQSLLEAYLRLTSTAESATADTLISSANRFHLLSNLRSGLSIRPMYLRMTKEQPKIALTIAQLCNIPLAFHRLEAEQFNLSIPLAPDEQCTSLVSPSCWLPADNQTDLHRTAVYARLVARVASVFPSAAEDLNNVLIVACDRCHSAIRMSALLHSKE